MSAAKMRVPFCAQSRTVIAKTFRPMSSVEEPVQPAATQPLQAIPKLPLRYQRVAVALVVVLYLAVVSPHWFITSDSALYLMLGESLADGEGYTLFGRPHAHVPPGFPLLIAALTRFGLGGMLCLNLFMTVLGLATLWLSYKLLREHVAASAAAIATLALAVSYDMYAHSAMQLSEIPFMFLVVLGLWGYSRGLKGERGWMEFGSACLVASCWVRVIGAPLVVAAAVGLVLQGGRARWQRTLLNAFGVATALAITAAAFNAQYEYAKKFYNPESYRVVFEALTLLPTESRIWSPLTHTYETGAHLFRLFTGQSVPNAVGWFAPGLPILIGLGLAIRRRQWTIALAVTGYITGLLLLNPAISRYLLPVAPLLIVFYLDGAMTVLRCIPRLAPYRGQLVAAIAAIIVLVNVPKDLRLIYRMHVVRTGYEVQWRSSMLEIVDFVRTHSEPGEKFASTDSQREIAYLSHVPFVETSNPAAIEELIVAENVGLVIIGPDRRHSWRYPQLRTMVEDTRRFTPIFRNDLYQVFEVAEASHLAATAQETRHN